MAKTHISRYFQFHYSKKNFQVCSTGGLGAEFVVPFSSHSRLSENIAIFHSNECNDDLFAQYLFEPKISRLNLRRNVL